MSRTCIKCGKDISDRPPRSIYCEDCAHERKKERSRECYARNYKKNKQPFMAECTICGKRFRVYPSTAERLKTCSVECRNQQLSRNMLNGLAAQKEPKRLEGLRKSPKTGRFETHIHAKAFTVTSPDGTVYNVRNLKLWCDQNEALHGATGKQAYTGFCNALSTIRGRREKRKMWHWHGWTIEDAEDM